MKLMLVRVSTDAYFPPQQRRPRLEHLGLGYLAACLRQKGQVVEIVDAELERLSETQVMARLTEECDTGNSLQGRWLSPRV
jgi:hypothetical protein